MNYHIARNGQQLGIFSESEVRSQLQTGRLYPTDLCWAEGMADWQPLSSIGFAAVVSAQPPFAPPTGPYNPYAPPSVDVAKVGIYGQPLTLASAGARLGANCLNALVMIAVCIPLGFGAALSDKPETETLGVLLCSLSGLAFLGLIVYNLYLLTTRGQSLGKKWVGIKVVNFDDQGNPGFVKIILLRLFVNGLIGSVVPFYGIVDPCFIFREDRRCIHDLLASTTVVVADK